MEYADRSYRLRMGASAGSEAPRFRCFVTRYLETDLWIGIDPLSYREDLPEFVLSRASHYRNVLEAYGASRPIFFSSHIPIESEDDAPAIARRMMDACVPAGVGPMAAVAGAVAHAIALDIEAAYPLRELIVENGGDNYLRFESPLDVAIFAGSSPLSERVGVSIPCELSPLGVCTSSGTVGPSFSYGKADAAMVACRDPARADAWATALGNAVKSPADIESALALLFIDPEVLFALVIAEDRIAARGAFTLRFFEKE